jgi:hypothetical protein
MPQGRTTENRHQTAHVQSVLPCSGGHIGSRQHEWIRTGHGSQIRARQKRVDTYGVDEDLDDVVKGLQGGDKFVAFTDPGDGQPVWFRVDAIRYLYAD